MMGNRMSSPPDDALFEFAPDEPPDGLFQQGADTRAVPPPIHNEIDGLVDAISAGGRPRLSGESDLAAEADDSDLADIAVAQHAIQRSTSSVLHTAAFRHVAYSIAAFAFGTVVAWSVLRGFDAQPAPIAVRQPAAVEPATTPAPTAIAPRASAPAPTPAPPTRPAPIEREPARVVAAAPPAVAAREPRAAAASSTRSTATGVVTRPGAAAPIAAPKAPAAASRTPLPIAPAPAAVPAPIDAAPKDGGNFAALPPAAPAVIAPPPAAAAPAAASAIAGEQSAVLEILREYRQAYEALDVTATAAVWPSVDRRALTRAFSTLKSQQLALNDCAVSIAGASATTRCRGTVEYVRKIGSPTPRTGHQDLIFKMRKLGSEWFIDEVSASESVVARR
jgi:hypothetical protein